MALKIRQPNVVETFYPAETEKLTDLINVFLQQAKPLPNAVINKPIKAIIVPHAGYVYSGQVATTAYQALTAQAKTIQQVIVLGPSHYVEFKQIALDDCAAWQTPLGMVPINRVNNSTLFENENFVMWPEVFSKEHSIEVQLPFLQTVLSNFQIVPLCCGQLLHHQTIAQILIKILKENSLIVVSSDLSHFQPVRIANELDQTTIQAILQQQTESTNEACGIEGIAILNCLAKILNWQPYLLDYSTSAAATGDKRAVVGYASIAYV